MKKLKCLWIGDAVVETGFARVTHNVVGGLHELGWDVQVLGINHLGDPHSYPYPIWPAVIGGDPYGMGRLPALINRIKPDIIVIMNDPWIIRDYLEVMKQDQRIPKNIPVVAYMPVDAPNQSAAAELGDLKAAILYTAFGQKELMLGGYAGPSHVIPHGVDTTIYQPKNKQEARKRLKFKNPRRPEDLFIVGNVNRNTIRKRMDLSIMYWTQWWVNAGQPDHAYLYLHCSNTEEEGWNLIKLAKYFGMEEQLIMTNPNMNIMNFYLKQQEMAVLYSMFDVQINTGMGEGWGLTNHEGMACGVPQILPRYSALGEWCDGAVHYVDVTSWQVAFRGINTIGGIADKQQFVDAIDKFYRDKLYREEMGQKALARARDPRYNWANIVRQFDLVLQQVALESKPRPVGVEAPQHGQIQNRVQELPAQRSGPIHSGPREMARPDEHR